MERDIDLVRRIVLEVAKLPSNTSLTELEGVDPATFVQHAQWLEQAGLIEATFHLPHAAERRKAFIRSLTWAGCEFRDAMRDESLWKKAKEAFVKPAASFSLELLKDFLIAEVRKGFPSFGA